MRDACIHLLQGRYQVIKRIRMKWEKMRLKKNEDAKSILVFLSEKQGVFSGEYCMTELVTSALDPDGK